MFFFFFFQAEDGIRDGRVTGVQTCALPIYGSIHEHVNVTGLVAESKRVFVHVEDETVEAGILILATNAWTSLLAPSVKISPRRAQMLAMAPVDRVTVEKPTYSDFGYRYWRQLTSGVLLIGDRKSTRLNSSHPSI